jgi:hypothetical protein
MYVKQVKVIGNASIMSRAYIIDSDEEDVDTSECII